MNIFQLEEAARIVQSPPNILVSAEKRSEAELVFFQMRKLPKPYSFCESILEGNCSHYTRFQAVLTLKDAVLREWLSLTNEEKDIIQQYLWNYITKQTSLPQYILQHISVLIAVLIKRGSLEPDGIKRINNYILKIFQLLSDSSNLELGCCLLSCLLIEFSSSNGSSTIGMPLDFHVKCKKAIETNDVLLNVFTAVIQTLEYTATSTDINAKKLSSILSLSLEVLSWDFRSPYGYNLKQLRSSINYCTPLQPPASFHVIFLNPALLCLFVKIFQLCYENVDLAHISTLCLSQLASLSGPIFTSSEYSKVYLENYLQNLLPVVSNSERFNDGVVYGIACVFRQLTTAFARTLYSALNMKVGKMLVETVLDYFAVCAQRIVNYEIIQRDVSLLEESLCCILEVVVRLLEEPVDELRQQLKSSIIKIVSVYFSCKLHTPQGIKQYQAGSHLRLDLDDDDRDLYADELSYIGTIFRHVPQTSLTTALALTLQCYSKVWDLSLLLISSQESVTLAYELETLYENIHWLLLIMTYILTDVVDGEERGIPTVLFDELHNYENCTLTTLSIEELITKADDTSECILFSIDPVVALIVCVCKWSFIEDHFIGNGLKEFVSPQVCETAIWSLCTILSSYLFASLKVDKISPMLRELVVDNTANSKQLLCFTLKRITRSITVWSGEDKVVTTCVQGLLHLAQFNKSRASFLCTADDVWVLMKMFANGEDPFTRMSPSLNKNTIAGLLNCARGSNREVFVSELLKPLKQRFEVVSYFFVSSNEETQQQILTLLESLTGVAEASHSSIVHCVFPFLFPILCTCIQLLETFCDHQDISQIVLSLFYHVAENFIIFLDDSNVQKLYELFSKLIDVYAKFYIGKYINKQANVNDEQLTTFIQTLSHLTTKDYMHLQSAESTAPTEVVLKGFTVVLSIIDGEILKFAEVSKCFYQLLHYICDIFPENFIGLPVEILDSTFKLMILGFTQFGSDVALLCVECIESVSCCSSSKSEILIHYKVVFLNELLLRLFNHFFESDLLPSIAGAIYQLMCSIKDNNINLTDILLPTLRDSKGGTVKRTLDGMFISTLMTGSRVHKKEFIKTFLDAFPSLCYDFLDNNL